MSGANWSTQAHSIGQFGHKIADGTSLDCWLVRCPPSALRRPPSALRWWGVHHQRCTGEVSIISAALVRHLPLALQWWGTRHQHCSGEVSTISATVVSAAVVSAAVVRYPPSVLHWWGVHHQWSTVVVRCPPSVIHCGRVKYCTKWPITFGFSWEADECQAGLQLSQRSIPRLVFTGLCVWGSCYKHPVSLQVTTVIRYSAPRSTLPARRANFTLSERWLKFTHKQGGRTEAVHTVCSTVDTFLRGSPWISADLLCHIHNLNPLSLLKRSLDLNVKPFKNFQFHFHVIWGYKNC